MKPSCIFSLMNVLMISTLACSKPEPPEYLDEDDFPADTKEFCIYNAMSYDGKPDEETFLKDKISPISLIYEAFLLGDDKELDMEKVQTQIDLVKVTGGNTVSTDIEEWYSSKTGDEMKAGFTTLFDKFKEAIPGCNIGNYGIPVSDLNVLRYNPNMAGKTEDEIIARWKSGSEKRMKVAEVCDVLYPSLYAMNPDIARYVQDLDITVNYIRENFPNKKIVGYLWPQYYNLASNEYYQQFISKDDWTTILEACYERLDGVIIWSHGKDENNVPVKWSDPRVQEIYAATKAFISKHYDNIKIDVANGSGEGDYTRVPEEFTMWEDLNFTNTPDDLLKFGLQPINYAVETVFSEKDPVDGVYEPILPRITKLGESVTRTVLINPKSWISDRSTNNAAMVERFKNIYETFKAANSTAPIGYVGIGPTQLTQLAGWSDYETDFARKDSWLRYAVEPTRVLRQYADALYVDVTMIDDDLDFWKSDCSLVFEEARRELPAGKKIYACIGAVYYGNRKLESCYVDIFKPIKEETWLEALEYLYLRCDGIVILGNCPESDPVEYSESIGMMKATKTFYENHKSVIDKTLPDSPISGSEIPVFSDEDQPPVEYRESIVNGGFEDELVPSSTDPAVHGTALVRPLRLAGFFDRTAQTTFPKVTSGTTVPDGTWFHRCNNNKWFWFTYIDDTSMTYSGSDAQTPIAHTGTKSAVLYPTVCANTSYFADHADNLEHLFSLAQTLALDDSKVYELTFWYNRPTTAWQNQANNIEELIVGIVSSTGANKNTDTTYEQTITLDKSGEWVKCSVTFDLPEIIGNNPGISFNKCAIHFNPVPVTGPDGGILKCIVNIDDVTLEEANQ